MQTLLDQVVQLLQQGVAAIFRLIGLVWSWSSSEIARLLQVPFESWPLWKQVLLVLIVVAVITILFSAALRLWMSAVRVLAAFASLLVSVVATLPAVLLAGVVALGGLWAINHLNPSQIALPSLTRTDGEAQQARRDAQPATPAARPRTDGN